MYMILGKREVYIPWCGRFSVVSNGFTEAFVDIYVHCSFELEPHNKVLVVQSITCNQAEHPARFLSVATLTSERFKHLQYALPPRTCCSIFVHCSPPRHERPASCSDPIRFCTRLLKPVGFDVIVVK